MMRQSTLGVLLTVTLACEPPAEQVEATLELPDTVTFSVYRILAGSTSAIWKRECDSC